MNRRTYTILEILRISGALCCALARRTHRFDVSKITRGKYPKALIVGNLSLAWNFDVAKQWVFYCLVNDRFHEQRTNKQNQLCKKLFNTHNTIKQKSNRLILSDNVGRKISALILQQHKLAHPFNPKFTYRTLLYCIHVPPCTSIY